MYRYIYIYINIDIYIYLYISGQFHHFLLQSRRIHYQNFFSANFDYFLTLVYVTIYFSNMCYISCMRVICILCYLFFLEDVGTKNYDLFIIFSLFSIVVHHQLMKYI